MPEYKAPLRDIQFVVHEMFNSGELYQSLPGYEDATPDLMNAIIEEAAKFSENVLSPLNQSGDEEGCEWSAEGVKTPAGFAEAYKQYVEGGWPALSAEPGHGGQGMPGLMGIINNELAGTANWSWLMYPGLSHGAIRTIEEHGDEQQKDQYLTKLICGRLDRHHVPDRGPLWYVTWACCAPRQNRRTTAPTRLLAPRSSSVPASTTWPRTSFISSWRGCPDAPEGTHGISLFIVPKFKLNAEGGVGERNGVHCASIEKKMGIKASATCVMNFDGATGYLIGPPNKGLNCMFTFMNTARIGTAIQGLAHAELAYQGALAYARDRLAMRSLTGPKNPDGPADPIIVHPDVRRMLLTQKAIAEGSRAFLYFLAQQGDIVHARYRGARPRKPMI